MLKIRIQTFSSLQSIFLAVSLHPEVLKNAHNELDKVVGSHRLPDFDDQESLVYINAIVKESLRWQPVVPLSVPHCTVSDDELHGYFIPAGTVLIPNTWYVPQHRIDIAELIVYHRACLHDPDEYDDPEVFRPERFIKDGKLNPNVRDPTSFAFGYGRRLVELHYLN